MAAPRFLIKQRAFIKLVMIHIIEKHKSYGMQANSELLELFQSWDYKPNHSEIYRSLHELQEEGIVKRRQAVQEGKKMQVIYIYEIDDPDKARLYKKQVKEDLDRSAGLIRKATEAIF